MLVTLYVHGRRGEQCPTLQLRDVPGGLFEEYQRQFEHLWAASRPVAPVRVFVSDIEGCIARADRKPGGQRANRPRNQLLRYCALAKDLAFPPLVLCTGPRTGVRGADPRRYRGPSRPLTSPQPARAVCSSSTRSQRSRRHTRPSVRGSARASREAQGVSIAFRGQGECRDGAQAVHGVAQPAGQDNDR